MNAQTSALEVATIEQQCKVLHLPAIAAQCGQLAGRYDRSDVAVGTY